MKDVLSWEESTSPHKEVARVDERSGQLTAISGRAFYQLFCILDFLVYLTSEAFNSCTNTCLWGSVVSSRPKECCNNAPADDVYKSPSSTPLTAVCDL